MKKKDKSTEKALFLEDLSLDGSLKGVYKPRMES